MSSTTNISQADGALTIGGIEKNDALLADDPRADPRAAELAGFSQDALEDYAGRLHSLAELAQSTGGNLKSIEGAVKWEGSGAANFKHALNTTTPELTKLSQSYLDASHAIYNYATNGTDDKTTFNKYAAQIAHLTFQLTGFEENKSGGYTPGTAKVTPSSPNYQSVCNDLTTAKKNGFSALDSFITTRNALKTALNQSTEKAPKAPPWWLKQMGAVLTQLEHVKGVSKTDLARARNLQSAEAAYEKDPSAANKAKLDQDLAAIGLIATAASTNGGKKGKGLATELLDDEAGSLQALSNHEAGVGKGKNDAITQAQQDAVVAALGAGNIKGAIGDLKTMAGTAENPKQDTTAVDATNGAKSQADGEAKKTGATGNPAPTTGGTTGNSGGNAPTGTAATKIDEMTKQANALLGKPYIWAGGHSGWGPQKGYDCSGFVSKVLHAAGYLSEPCTTQSLPGQPGILNGPGQHVTIYDCTDAGSNDHTIIDINGQFYESGGAHGSWGGGGGVEKIGRPSASYLAEFNLKLHPAGL